MSGEFAKNYQKISGYFASLSNGGSLAQTDVSTAISLTQECIRERDSMNLFSRNEDLEDYSTTIIQYLFLEYFLAKFCTQFHSLDRRDYYLVNAKKSFETYLERCCSLRGLLHKEEVAQFAALFPKNMNVSKFGDEIQETEGKRGFVGEEDEEDGASLAYDAISAGRGLAMKFATPTVLSATPEQQRSFKIGRFRREKGAQQRIRYLQEQQSKNAGTKISSSSLLDTETEGAGGYVSKGDGEAIDRDNNDEEEELRELYILQMQSYARDSLDEMPLLEQELVMLSMMNSMREQQQDQRDGAGSLNDYMQRDRRFNDVNDPTGQARANIMHMPVLPQLPVPGSADAPGIEVTRTSKGIDGQLIMNREVVKAHVFVPSMQGPTMSLEEFADQEKAAAIERSRIQADNIASGKGEYTENETRRYAQLEADGDEDVMRLVDAATLKDREWDTFKEHNPRGWGNKGGKRF